MPTPLRLFILGSTGKTGIALVEQATARGHNVTTFGRAAANGIIGDPMNADALAAAMTGHDTVLSSIGSQRLIAGGVRTASARAVGQAMERSGVRRLVILSSTLIDAHQGATTWLMSRTLLRSHANDQRTMEAAVRGSNSEWTIVRPPTLTNGPLTGRPGVVESEAGEGRVSRADTARLMLDIVESGRYIRQVIWLH